MQDSPTPDRPRSHRKAGLIGAAIGSIGLAASIFALTATAGAAGPVLHAQDAESEPVPVVEETFPDEEAWTEFETCIDAVFGEADFFESHDIDGNFDDFDFGPAVSIMDGDDMSFAEFGEGDGSITITKTGDDISVTSDGDVTLEEFNWDDADGIGVLEGHVLDGDFEMLEGFDDEAFEELDAALSGCDDKLPEGVDLDHDFEDAEVFEFDGNELKDADEAELADVS